MRSYSASSPAIYKGRVDDAIQYLYTMLSSIPSVLLIAAFVLMIQVFIDKNPQMFETGLERADIRLFLLSAILGVTGWAALARLLRAETLKLSELDYVQAARAFGVSDVGIMRRHILPNVTHVVLIVAVLDFSGLVLYEAVLSYVGVGVDPLTNSFGTMINSARIEMSRDPVVWWTLLTAFAFMVALVLSMQLFAGAVNEAFDPRARAFRVRRARPPAQPVAGSRSGSGQRRVGGPMLEIENLTTEIDSDYGLVRAVDALTADDRARRDLRAGRRVGLRQVDDRAFDPAAAAGRRARQRRPRRRRRHRHHPVAGGADARHPRPAHQHHLPGAVDEPQSGDDRRPPDHRGHRTPHCAARRGGAGQGGRLAAAGRHTRAGASHRRLSRSRCPADRSSA